MGKQNVFKAVGRAYDSAFNLLNKINADFKTKPFSIRDIIVGMLIKMASTLRIRMWLSFPKSIE